VVVAASLSAADIAGSWTIAPLAVVVSVAAAVWYRQASRAHPDWPRRRTAWFGLGLLLWLLVCCGPAERFGASVYWVWVSQILGLLLVVPIPLMLGQPGELVGRPALLSRFSSPLVGPALMPVVAVAALFGPVPGWSAEHPAVAGTVQLVVLVLGCLIVYPLVSVQELAGSVAVGIAVAVGFFELLVDAVPGLVLRLSTHPVTSFFDHRRPLAAAPPWLHDQQIGGAVLWCVAELLDLPFLVLVFRRWVRADAREAAAIDAALAEEPEDDTPWFLKDPQLRDRLR